MNDSLKKLENVDRYIRLDDDSEDFQIAGMMERADQ